MVFLEGINLSGKVTKKSNRLGWAGLFGFWVGYQVGILEVSDGIWRKTLY
jgi:hypothetical protein